jgi:hypothetical protein
VGNTMTYSASSGQKKNDKHINSEQHHDILSQPELAEYVMVLSTVYMFVIFLLTGAG